MDVLISMPDAAEMPPATTPEGVNIHLGYIRRDLLDMKKQSAADLQEIKNSLSALGDHFVSEEAFKPITEAVEAHGKNLKELNTWKDNLQGRMIGFAAGISAASAGGAAILVKLFGG